MPKRSNTNDFIKKAKEKHGDRYDYSKVEYLNNSTKVKIGCEIHGYFMQSPVVHTSQGAGCRKCAHDSRRLSIKELIRGFKEIHGDKYDYSKVDYVNVDTPVIITCPEHGDFSKTPYEHKRGRACNICSIGRIGPRIDRDTWIDRWVEKHDEKYDYSLVPDVIGRNSDYVEIVCPEHGKFVQRVAEHWKYGCQQCHQPRRGIGTEGWIDEFRKVHGDRYDYSKFRYKKNNVVGIIICKEHGEFYQAPSPHILGSGCPRCHYMRGANTEEWIKRCREIHGNTYDYSKMDYVRSSKKVTITCKIHGDFLMLIGNHVHKTSPQGCAECAESGFKSKSTAFLYCMKYSGPLGDFWKIGITSNVERRKNTLQSSINKSKIYFDYNIEIDNIVQFDRGNDAQQLELELLSLDDIRYIPNEKFDGHTELFSLNPFLYINYDKA